MARWLIAATLIAVAGLGLGGWSLYARSLDIGADSDRNAWDQASATHAQCVASALARAGTIETGHNDFEREEAGLNRDASTIELIGSIISLGNPASPIVVEASALVNEKRTQLEADRQQLAADRVEFDKTRPPLDASACPPAPAGPRP